MNENFEQDNNQTPSEFNNAPFYRLNPVVTAFTALVGIFILYQVGGAILTLIIFGMDFEKADVNSVRLLTMGGQIMLMLLPTLILARFAYPTTITKILRVKPPKLKEIGIFLAGLLILSALLQSYLFLQNYFLNQAASIFPTLKKITDLLDQMDKLLEKTYSNLIGANSLFEASFVIFITAVVPAICEEFLFRGLVQKSFELKYKPLASIFITSLFFGLYHFNPYGLIALIALGFYFGFAAYVSNSILIPVILHFTNNFLAVVAFLTLGTDELMGTNVKHSGSIIFQVISFILLLIIFSGFIFYVYKKFIKQKNENEGEI